MRHMVHLDVAVLGEIKRRQVIEEDDKEKNANKRKGTGSVPSTNTSKVVYSVHIVFNEYSQTRLDCLIEQFSNECRNKLRDRDYYAPAFQ